MSTLLSLHKNEWKECIILKTTSRNHDRLAGRLALTKAYAAAVGNDESEDFCQDLEISHLESGAPTIGDGAFFCSVAHSRGWAIGAVSARPIGADLEFATHRPYSRELRAFVGTKEEYEIISNETGLSASEEIARIWTIKESVRKALGQKRPHHPKDFMVVGFEKNVFLVSLLEDKSLWRVKQYIKGDLIYAIAERNQKTRQFSDVVSSVVSLDETGDNADTIWLLKSSETL